MMTGTVSTNREAVFTLEILGPDQQRQQVEAVIDTGFNGYLTLSGEDIASLRLMLVGHRRATLGDGSVVVLDAYLARVLWHERERDVLVLQANGGALLGMSLLYGNRVTMDVVENGDVAIDEIF